MVDENKVTTAPAKAVVTAPANVTVVTAPAKKAAAAPAKKVAAKKTAKKVATKPAAKVVKKAAKKATASKPAETVAENKLEQLQNLLQENLSGLNTDKAEAVAKNIWLAGLGAYSRSLNEFSERRDDIQSRVVTINSEGQKVFEDLVERGQAMQGEAEKAMK
ncbi:MAG: methylthioribose-1-phosphate isomerase, partial [Arenicella sp.]